MEDTDTQNQPTESYNNRNAEEFALYVEQCEIEAQAIVEAYQAHEQQEKLNQIVFSLEKSLPEIDSSMSSSFDNVLETNAHVLNAAFVYYMSNAHKSPDADRKINLALRAHSQMVRAINTWERLRISKNKGTN